MQNRFSSRNAYGGGVGNYDDERKGHGKVRKGIPTLGCLSQGFGLRGPSIASLDYLGWRSQVLAIGNIGYLASTDPKPARNPPARWGAILLV